MQRAVIEIDEERCNGCGQCILDCAEGALAIVNGKAKLISDVYCDGLGACLNCPQGALSLRTREAAPFDEAAAMQARLERENAGRLKPMAPKAAINQIIINSEREQTLQRHLASSLRTWPIQLQLMPRRADYLQNADILLAAQCSGFALPDIHKDWIGGRVPIIACPKLEDREKLIERLAAVIAENEIRSLTLLRMSVPCCDMEYIAREAIKRSGKPLKWETHVVQRA